ELRVADGDLQAGRAAVAETHEARFVDMQLLEQRRHVIRILLEAQWPVNVPRMPVSLKFDGDDLMTPGQLRQDAPERGLNRGPAAVQQHKRPAAAVDLVVEFEPIHRSVAAGWILGIRWEIHEQQ